MIEQMPEGCHPAARRQCQWGIRTSKAPPPTPPSAARCVGPGMAAHSPHIYCSRPKRSVQQQPRADCGPHTLPFSRELRLNPPLAPSSSPTHAAPGRPGAPRGPGRDKGEEGRPLCLTHTHPPALDARAGAATPGLELLAPFALRGSLPPFVPPRSPPTGCPSRPGPSFTLTPLGYRPPPFPAPAPR